MADTVILPPDKGTVHRTLVARWDRLWKGTYSYDTANRSTTAEAAPGYTRSFSRLVAGLFQRQAPTVDTDSGPLTPPELSALLEETTAKAAGYGSVVRGEKGPGLVGHQFAL